MSARSLQSLEQIRRILLLAAGGRQPAAKRSPTVQLELPFFPEQAPAEAAPDRLRPETQDSIHELGVELVILIQMECAGLVASPLGEGRKRLRFGTLPSLRLLDEWSRGPALEANPWDSGL